MTEKFFADAIDRVGRLRASARRLPADLRTDRVPPGQRVTTGFPVLHYGGVPRFDPTR